MSRENVEVVHQRVCPEARPRRSPEEQLLVRLPRVRPVLLGGLWRVTMWLPARSRLRRAIVRRYATRLIEAINRRDFEAAFSIVHPNFESTVDDKLAALGFDPRTDGPDARLAMQRRWMEEWGEVRTQIEEIVDLGDGRFLLLTRLEGSGLSSGVAVGTECAFIFTLADGFAVREQIILDHAAALEAVGLRE